MAKKLTPADFKALALSMAYVALAKTLSDAGVIEMDHLLGNLAGARARLEQLGEVEAAELLGHLNENLTSI